MASKEKSQKKKYKEQTQNVSVQVLPPSPIIPSKLCHQINPPLDSFYTPPSRTFTRKKVNSSEIQLVGPEPQPGGVTSTPVYREDESLYESVVEKRKLPSSLQSSPDSCDFVSFPEPPKPHLFSFHPVHDQLQPVADKPGETKHIDKSKHNDIAKNTEKYDGASKKDATKEKEVKTTTFPPESQTDPHHTPSHEQPSKSLKKKNKKSSLAEQHHTSATDSNPTTPHNPHTSSSIKETSTGLDNQDGDFLDISNVEINVS